jgi:Protein of unknown function (DUF2846)
MRVPIKSFILGSFLALLVLPPLHAQTPGDASAAVNSAAAKTTTPGHAPDVVMKKLSDLVHASKYAEAQQLTAGLLLVYPEDQRLVKAKALLDKSLAPGGSATVAPASNPPSNNSPSAPPPANSSPDQLTGMDKVDYSALIELVRQAQQEPDLTEQTKLLETFMDQSALFLQQHPDQMLLWQLRVASAISLHAPLAGFEAAQKLLAAGAADGNDPSLLQLLAKLKLLGWMDRQQAEALQGSADKEREQQAASTRAEHLKAESAKYTFPVAHAHGFSYSYGHMTMNEDDAVYVADDETIHLSKSDIRELKVYCVANNMCGLYFYPRDGRKFFFVAVTEYAVANKTVQGNVIFPPSVIGNAVVARWKFVSTDKRTLSAPSVVQSSAPATSPTPALLAAAPTSESTVQNPEPTTSPAPEPAPNAEPSSAPVDHSTPVETAANNTVLHVYRPHRLTAAAQKPYIYVDGKQIATIANSQEIRMLLTPGKHTITVSKKYVENQVPIDDLTMAAGSEYWVRVDISAGAWEAHSKLYLVPTEQAQDESKHMKEIRIDDVFMN